MFGFAVLVHLPDLFYLARTPHEIVRALGVTTLDWGRGSSRHLLRELLLDALLQFDFSLRDCGVLLLHRFISTFEFEN